MKKSWFNHFAPINLGALGVENWSDSDLQGMLWDRAMQLHLLSARLWGEREMSRPQDWSYHDVIKLCTKKRNAAGRTLPDCLNILHIQYSELFCE